MYDQSRARYLNLLLDVLVGNGHLDGLLREVHIARKGGVRLPLARGAGSGLLQHLVDLLKSEALGLRDEEVRNYNIISEVSARRVALLTKKRYYAK
jgi:hypothetical protein